MIEIGAPIGLPDGVGDSPLHHAVNLGQKDAAVLLIHAKAAINAQNELGQTPLMLAIQKKDRALIAQLVQAGADVNIKDGQGRDGREWASRHQIPESLLQNGKKAN